MALSMAGDGAQARSIEEIVGDQQQRDILRFLTCGSVDDGKSTLIGRLLYDSKSIPEDQLAKVEADSRRIGSTGGDIDLAFLTDGLQAEREQGITIDVAYRYFATSRRKFIVADTPGHEQYTRNMVTGASTCDFAVVLADARCGLVEQTRRHACILSMMGIRKLALAVNKMDLVGYQQDRFENIAADFARFAGGLGFSSIMAVPLSALRGDNIVSRGVAMDWYTGPTLMTVLETVEVAGDLASGPLRLPVQWVNRPDGDFRGFAGTVASGVVRAGDAVRLLPQDRQTHVTRIVTVGGDVETAEAGDAVTLTLADEIDVGRGDVLSAVDEPPSVADQIAARLIWLGERPMLPGRTYLLKLGSQTAVATITALKYKLDVNTLAHQAGRTLDLNEVGVCNLGLSRPLVFDAYQDNRDMGGFILIDRLTNATVGAGMIEFGLRRATNLHWQALEVGKSARAEIKHQKPCVLWFTGLSGAGKTTVANIVERLLHAHGRHTYLLDGDNVRHGLNRDLGFTDTDRVENIRRVAETARLFVDAGLIVLVALISPFRIERRMARELFATDEFIEVFVDTPLDVCEQRDPKGLYKKARAGLLKNFTGVDSLYEPPERPEIHLDADASGVEDLAETIIAELERRRVI